MCFNKPCRRRDDINQQPHAPIYFGGASDAAIRVGAKHSDVYALFGEPRAAIRAIRAMMDRITTEAAQYSRKPRFNISFWPIIAKTEGAAWDKARGILAQLKQSPQKLPVATEAEFSRRLTQIADEGEVYDERLWTGLVKVSGASGNTRLSVTATLSLVLPLRRRVPRTGGPDTAQAVRCAYSK